MHSTVSEDPLRQLAKRSVSSDARMNANDQAVTETPEPSTPTRPTLRRIEAIVNAASGSVGTGAADALEALIASYGVDVHVVNAQPRDIAAATRKAVDASPDLVVVLAGDGTAALAAGYAGVDGPLIAPLPGGTMNMLPHALYGAVNWRQAIVSALTEGVERPISGGEIGGRSFYVAAILGTPALWAEAREAVRAGRAGLAFARAKRAFRRAFSHKIHYRLQEGERDKTEALILMCPMVSRGLAETAALEAAALDPHDAAELLRLGFNAVTGRWRADPSVRTTACVTGSAWSRLRIPAVLDGEPCRLARNVDFRFRPVAFRALAPPPLTPSDPAAVESGVPFPASMASFS